MPSAQRSLSWESRAAFSCVGAATRAIFRRSWAGFGEGAPLPTTVRDSNFNPHRLLTLRTRNSAAYKGIYALLGKVAVDRVRNQEYVVPGDGSEDDRCDGQDAVYDE